MDPHGYTGAAVGKGWCRLIAISVHPGRITVSGHAGYADPGKDIVCAAVSALLQTLERSLESLTDDVIDCQIAPGSAQILFDGLSDRGRVLIDSFYIGACLLSNSYPDYVYIV